MNVREYKRPASNKTKYDPVAKTVTRGATREQPRDHTNSLKWGRYLILVAALSAGFFGLAQINWGAIYHKAYVATNRPLANIKIEGEFRFVAKETLQSLISEKLDGSFVDLDLGAIKHAIESDPWVANVTIERIWPDSLKLAVKEHTPIARWNDDGFIASDGELIKVGSNGQLGHLPLLAGDQFSSRDLTKNYLAFSEILKSSALKIRDLKVDSQLSWSIAFEEGFLLVLGRDNIQERLESFSYVYAAYLKEKKVKLERIDMRYERGLAVKWKDESELVAASSIQ